MKCTSDLYSVNSKKAEAYKMEGEPASAPLTDEEMVKYGKNCKIQKEKQ